MNGFEVIEGGGDLRGPSWSQELKKARSEQG